VSSRRDRESKPDEMTEIAAKLYDIDPKDVTPAQRNMAKTATFAERYSRQVKMADLQVVSVEPLSEEEAAKNILADFKKRFPGVQVLVGKAKETDDE